MSYRVSEPEFDALVRDAIAGLPQWLLDVMTDANIDVVIEPHLSAAKRHDLGLAPDEGLLGLYEGVPLDQRVSYGNVVPDKITLFQHEIEDAANSHDDLVEQIETTLKHEIHHGLGADEERVHDAGLG